MCIILGCIFDILFLFNLPGVLLIVVNSLNIAQHYLKEFNYGKKVGCEFIIF